MATKRLLQSSVKLVGTHGGADIRLQKAMLPLLRLTKRLRLWSRDIIVHNARLPHSIIVSLISMLSSLLHQTRRYRHNCHGTIWTFRMFVLTRLSKLLLPILYLSTRAKSLLLVSHRRRLMPSTMLGANMLLQIVRVIRAKAGGVLQTSRYFIFLLIFAHLRPTSGRLSACLTMQSLLRI